MDINELKFKADGGKPNRTLFQFDKRAVKNIIGPTLDDYCVVLQPGAVAGNHYHFNKREAFCVVLGELYVTFVDPQDLKDRVVKLLKDDGRVLVVPDGIAHAVENKTDKPAVLMVFATEPARLPQDDIEFMVV